MTQQLPETHNADKPFFYHTVHNPLEHNDAMALDPNERLRDLRRAAGYHTGSKAARAFGWNISTYLSHENGSRNMDPETAERYARAFRADPGSILWGLGRRPGPPPRPESIDLERLRDLIQSALVMHGNMPFDEARELATALIRRARPPQSEGEAGPEEAR